jgi:hypothetical protein
MTFRRFSNDFRTESFDRYQQVVPVLITVLNISRKNPDFCAVVLVVGKAFDDDLDPWRAPEVSGSWCSL